MTGGLTADRQAQEVKTNQLDAYVLNKSDQMAEVLSFLP